MNGRWRRNILPLGPKSLANQGGLLAQLLILLHTNQQPNNLYLPCINYLHECIYLIIAYCFSYLLFTYLPIRLTTYNLGYKGDT